MGLGSPSLAGQVNLGFPVFAQMRRLGVSQLAHVSHASFVLGQPLMTGVVAGMVAEGALILPIALPILPPARTAACIARLGAASGARGRCRRSATCPCG